MALTITIPGAIEATTGATAPAVLTIGVGIPGPGVPTGGTTGQVLKKLSSTNYDTAWQTDLNSGVWGSITGTLSSQTDLQTALNLKADLASPALTGVPTAPTASTLTSTTQLATTAFVQQELAAGTAVARNLEVEVRNQSGSSMPAGSIVYISGATGNKPLITLAQANNDANSAQTIGFVKTTIANNGTGYVIVRGVLDNIDTSALTEGVQLYLSPSTAGTWTTTKPYAPQHLVYVGIVIRSHPTQGTILVSVQNGYELDELHNVAAQTPSNNDLLAYETATSLWKNKTFSALGLLTSADAATTYYPLSGNPSGFLTSASLSGYAQLSGATFTGEVSTPASTTTTAGFSIAPGTAPTSPTNGEIWNTGTDIQVRIAGVTETLAEQSWVTTQLGSYLTTASAASTYAPIASPALTGNVTITANSASPALVITQDGAGDVVQFKDVTSDTTYTFIDANGKVNTIAATTANAGFNIAHGAAPTTPANGDIWTTTSGLFMRQNGTTQQYVDLAGTQTISGSKTFSNASLTLGNSTAASTYNLGTGATLTATTKAINIGTNGVSGSTTNIAIGSTAGTNAITINGPTTLAGNLIASGTSLDLGNTAAASATFSFGSATTTTSQTKTINLGTNGGTGSTTTINIGSSTGGSSTTALNGTVSSTTAAADTNTTQIATTAFVVGQAGSATPLVNGTAAVGTSLRYARQDHVHPTDTSRAALASPTFTGTPAAPTAAADTNTTQLATTAFVVGQASSTAPVMDGTAAVGTSLKYARADHVHASDTSKANLASPTFTGTPTAPTATAGTNTTQIATTAFVLANGTTTYATEAQLLAGTSTAAAINPLLLRTAMSNAGYTTYSSLIGNYSTYQSGTAGLSIYSDYVSPYVNVANGKMGFSPSSALNVNSMQGRGTAELVMNWTKPMWFSYRFHYGAAIGSDANTICRVTVGKTAATFGDLSSRGFGIKWDGSTTGLFNVMAHNGTTLTTVASSVSVSNTTYFPTNTSSADFLVYSDGAGNVTLFCNNVQIATTTGGPSSGSGAARFIFETDNTTSTTGMCAPTYMGIRSYFAY